ncbi:MAG: methanogen output domain 1-containing protein [Myxococcota bacterium]|nr:methanogen output domain 1-containing protein [Myxococcota bacterium]
MSQDSITANEVPSSLELERDLFLRSLIRELAGTLEGVVGLEQAAGFISLVGQQIGEWLDRGYREGLGQESLDHEQVAHALVDLKRRIQGDFAILSMDEEKIVFGNKRCPFEDKVHDRPSLCMMTSNVFGSIAANNLGYAKVELQETIAQGDSGCRVVVYLKRTPEAFDAEGREYFHAASKDE